MDKEEALKVLREAQTGWTIQEALETLIPELRESEDERIRKEIINYLDFAESHNLLRATDYEKKKEWIAYLEKQKEKERNITANLLEDGITGVQRELIEFLANNIDAPWVDVIKSADAYAQRIRSMVEKQKEPDYLEKFIKLPHLNSDYEVVDDWAYTPSLAHCDGNWGVCWVHCEDGDTLHECIGDTPAEAIDKAVEWFTSLEKPIRAKEVGAIISSRDKEETACGYLERCLTPDMRKVWYEACDELKKACFQEAEKQKEQKPAEWKDRPAGWNEEKEAKYQHEMSYIPKPEKPAERFAKAREKYQVEWSDEDEKDRAHIIRILDDCYAYGKHDLSKTDHENLVNKLKSRRPSWKPSEVCYGAKGDPDPAGVWKPSEEQMKALKEVAYNIVGTGTATDVHLVQLYEQLKKLM